MRPFITAIGIAGLAATLAAAPARAQQPDTGTQAPHLRVNDFFDQHPGLTEGEFEDFAAGLGAVLRFRQLGDAATLGKGEIDLSVQFDNTPIGGSKVASTTRPTVDQYLGRSLSFPRIVARFGLNDRVDLGVWGGFDLDAHYGLGGVDTKIALVRQEDGHPVSLSIRPSITSLFGPSQLWAGNVSVDLTLSRAFGLFAPYGGLAASSSAAIERSKDIDLAAATAGDALAYAGLSYRFHALVMSAEVEKRDQVSYAFRLGTRF
jgi:hypothetical protein